MKTLLVCCLLLATAALAQHNRPYTALKTEYEWKYFDYKWQSEEQRRYFRDNGLYDPKAMAPIDVDKSRDGRTFVTVIRATGVPASVHTVSNVQTPAGNLLEPYPDWSWYENPQSCRGIVSAYRVAIDRCNQIWILDTGVFDGKKICPAQLLKFNLSNNQLLNQWTIPDRVAQGRNGKSLLVTPILETNGEFCERTLVYMADVQGNGLVVFDGIDFYRLPESPVYAPEDQHVNFTIAGESFTLADGVLGMALSPPQYPHGERYLSFRPMASLSLYGVDTRSIQFNKNGNGRVNYVQGRDVLPSQASAMAFSQEGTLFYGLTGEIAIGCWNMGRPLRPEFFKIAIQDPERLQFTSGMKALSRPVLFPEPVEQLLVMTNRLQRIYAGTQNLNEINFRIMRATIRDLIAGTICDKPRA